MKKKKCKICGEQTPIVFNINLNAVPVNQNILTINFVTSGKESKMEHNDDHMLPLVIRMNDFFNSLKTL